MKKSKEKSPLTKDQLAKIEKLQDDYLKDPTQKKQIFKAVDALFEGFKAEFDAKFKEIKDSKIKDNLENKNEIKNQNWI